MVRAGLLVGSAGLGVALLLMPGQMLSATLTQLGVIATTWLREGAVVTSGVGRLAAEWTGYAAAVGAIVLVLIAVHDEAMRGRVAVYPLLALVWTLMLGILALGLGAAGERHVPAVHAGARAGPGGDGPSCCCCWPRRLRRSGCRWLRLRRHGTGIGEDMLDRSDPPARRTAWAASGSCWCWWPRWRSCWPPCPRVRRRSQRSRACLGAAAGLQDWLALSVETARTQLTVYDSLGLVVGLLAVASLAVLCLHLASQRRVGWARLVLFALWSGGALAGAGVSVYLLLQVAPGQWSGARVATAIVLAALFVRALIALGSLGRWAGLRTEGQGREVHPVR